MVDNTGFSIEGWDKFVDDFSAFIDNWDAKKAKLLQNMGLLYERAIKDGNYVPVDTSRLVDNIFVFGEGIPQDYIEVGTNLLYAKMVNDGHVQHKRFLPAEKLTVGGKTKYLKNKDQKGIMLSERYIQGKFFMEKGFNDAKPKLEKLINSFMVQCAKEFEGSKL